MDTEERVEVEPKELELDVEVEELEPRIVPYDDGIVWIGTPRPRR